MPVQIDCLMHVAVARFSLVLLVGFLRLPVVAAVWLGLMVVGSVHAGRLRDCRCPLIVRLVG